MAYSVHLRQQALESLWEAMSWYNDQSPGLGHELQREFFDHLKKLQNQPAQYPLVFDRFRRILLKRFPYKVVYAIDERRKIVFVAVLWHIKKSPESLEKTLMK
jgi:hypothetical protein